MDIRRPRTEGRKKSEVRRPNPLPRSQSSGSSFQIFSDFEFRVSFGLRSSAFGFRPSPPLCSRLRPNLPLVETIRLVRAAAAGLEHAAHHDVVLQYTGGFGLRDASFDADPETLDQHRGLQAFAAILSLHAEGEDPGPGRALPAE